MRATATLGLLAIGAVAGFGISALVSNQSRPVFAASNDRHQENIMATGAVSVNPKVQTDGVWLPRSSAGPKWNSPRSSG